MNSETNRRKFLSSAAVVSISLPTLIPASALGRNGSVAPSNRIVVGGIGVGRRGQKVLDSFLQQRDTQFVAVADPQKARRELIKSQADKHYGNRDCAIYDDMSGVLERDDIDAVLVTTGDRWHATASSTTPGRARGCGMTTRRGSTSLRTCRRCRSTGGGVRRRAGGGD